ncbi:MAG: NUDIX hydrolase [Jatrophihabitans sp.]
MHDRRDLDATDSHWIAPGGGVEDEESPAQAAVRELYEETGLRVPLPPDAEPVYVERVEFSFAGSRFDQTNFYFLARVPAGLPVRPAARTEFEKVVALGHRWWPLDELDASDVIREPVTIVELIRQAVRVG